MNGTQTSSSSTQGNPEASSRGMQVGGTKVKVFVTGGTGYVGQAVADHLQADGHAVVLLQRPGTTRPSSLPVEVMEGDLFDQNALIRGCTDADAVVHLVGIIREVPKRGITMQRIHVEGTRRILAAAKTAGVRRFLHMSALGARPEAVSGYHRSKWSAEVLVQTSGLAWTIFRPSVIFGPGGPGPEFVGMLRSLVQQSPLVPVIGDGQFPLQPVSIETVAAAFASALVRTAAIRRTYELGGPDTVTYREILEQIARAKGKSLRCIRVPVGIARLAVPVLQRFPAFPLTADQLTMLLKGNVCRDGNVIYQDLELTPIPFGV